MRAHRWNRLGKWSRSSCSVPSVASEPEQGLAGFAKVVGVSVGVKLPRMVTFYFLC